ncbi:hypothetical protein [Streptomyces sp. 4F14]|uniref:hypothetical protein n=1 Tax=Streptomyces sp. 4F14 TaxID=3394380 RepID=UPI003A8C02BC
MNQPARTLYKVLGRLLAAPVAKAIVPMTELLDKPPAAALTAFNQGKPLPLTGPAFDPASAGRLRTATEELLAALGR